MLWLLQAARHERQMRVIQLYRQTAKKEHANILRRRQIIEDRKEELEYLNTQRVRHPDSLVHMTAFVRYQFLLIDFQNSFLETCREFVIKSSQKYCDTLKHDVMLLCEMFDIF